MELSKVNDATYIWLSFSQRLSPTSRFLPARSECSVEHCMREKSKLHWKIFRARWMRHLIERSGSNTIVTDRLADSEEFGLAAGDNTGVAAANAAAADWTNGIHSRGIHRCHGNATTISAARYGFPSTFVPHLFRLEKLLSTMRALNSRHQRAGHWCKQFSEFDAGKWHALYVCILLIDGNPWHDDGGSVTHMSIEHSTWMHNT